MRLLLILVLLAGPAMGQAPTDTTQAAQVVYIEHSMAGEYAQKGALGGGSAAAVFTAIALSLTSSGPSYEERLISGQPKKDRHAGKVVLLAGGLGIAGGAVLGAIIGSGERWTEEQRVTIMPLKGGAVVVLSLPWP